MGKTTANRKLWRKKGFEKLGTKSICDVQKQDRSNVLRSVLGMPKR
jgi:hypothetical protein